MADPVASIPGNFEIDDQAGYGAGAPPATPTTIALVSPAAGSNLDPLDAVTVDITNPTGLACVSIFAVISQGCDELVADDQGFTDRYADSVRTPITDGFRYEIRRAGGWPSQTLSIQARANGPGGE